MNTVLLVRHGSHDEVGRVLSGRSAIGLNAAGRAQATALARRLTDTPLRAILSSPRRRAVETAQAIAAASHLSVEIVDALDEVDFGSWAGRSFASLDGDPAWRRWNERRGQAGTPGGDTAAAAADRACTYLRSAALGGPLLCVSHCDVIRGIVARVLGLDLDHLLRFECDPGSLTTLALGAAGGRVVTLNERIAA